MDIRFFDNFGEILYFVSNKNNRNNQKPGLILTRNLIEKGVIDMNGSFK